VDTYRSEEEQVEALKRWWNENGRGVVVGVVLALGAGFGWQAWQQKQQQAAANASALYQQMLSALAVEDAQGAAPARELATRIKDEYRGSTYAQFAALHLARLAVNAGDLAAAESELRWVLAMADEGSEVHDVARLRLARVIAARGEVDQALDMLADPEPAYAASWAMARGDILLAEGRESEALAAFEAAAGSLAEGEPLPRMLTDKLEYLRARQGASLAEATVK
jgi:predicted negative regulator of RcsB-dependent stress response